MDFRHKISAFIWSLFFLSKVVNSVVFSFIKEKLTFTLFKSCEMQEFVKTATFKIAQYFIWIYYFNWSKFLVVILKSPTSDFYKYNVFKTCNNWSYMALFFNKFSQIPVKETSMELTC